jgi:hypothetical protein
MDISIKWRVFVYLIFQGRKTIMAIAKVSLNNLLLIAILASSSVNAASQDIKALQIKAGQGDIQASLELGKHFENAEGVEQIWVKR